MNTVGRATEIDVLIVGGGINGAGLFRDLCEQGLDVVIVEKNDFGSGTSAAASRLIHGGIKYLETGELGLVAQSTLERNLLLKNAPHLVRPLPVIIPMFSWIKGVVPALRTLFGSTTALRSRGALLVKFGLWLYDLYGSRHRVMPKHQFWFKEKTLRELPQLTKDIVAAGRYFDAMVTAPERLVLELVHDGSSANPNSKAFNYAAFKKIDQKTIRVEDAKGTYHDFVPRTVVNAAGPWIDTVNHTLKVDARLIGGSKGSHIIVDNEELVKALNGRMVYFEADDGRICLVFEFLGRALIGSTDIPAPDPDNVICKPEEIAYLLQSVHRLFPSINVTIDQIVFAYSGTRPLPITEGTEVGLISRNHSFPIFEPSTDRSFPVIALVGGKWTTFRGFAEEVADILLKRLARARRISTKGLPIGGGRDYPRLLLDKEMWAKKVSTRTGNSVERVTVLLERYGTTAQKVAESEGLTPEYLVHTKGYTRQEVSWIVKNEMVNCVADLVIRRTSLAVKGELTNSVLCELARVVAKAKNWSDDTMQDEIKDVTTLLSERHLMKLAN